MLYAHRSVAHLGSVCACDGKVDGTQWPWVFEWIPYAISHGLNPLYTHQIWSPGGLDLAAVTFAPATAIVGTPLSWLFGPIVAYNLVTIACPVVSGWAAYRLCVYLTKAPWAALAAGLTYGFSAFVLAHQAGHLHLAVAFFPPLLVLLVLRRIDGSLVGRRFVILLTLLLVVQIGISTEVLFTSTCLGAITLASGWALSDQQRRAEIRAALPAIIGSFVAAGLICSYYLWFASRVPAYAKNEGAVYPADLLSYVFPTPVFQLGGRSFLPLSSLYITRDWSEQNSYLGIPLLCIFIGFLVRQWHTRLAKVVAIPAAVAFVFSLGTALTIDGHATITMPYRWVEHLPFFDLIDPSRLGLYVALAAAVVLAVWLSQAAGRQRWWRCAATVLVIAFLVPNLGQISRGARWLIPRFFTTSIYRHYLHQNELVMPIPFAYTPYGLSLLWQAQTGMYFRLVGGYFGPGPVNYGNQPIIHELTTYEPGPDAAAQLRQFLAIHNPQAVVVDKLLEGPWPAILVQAGWHHTASAAGIEIFKPDSK
jgi:hypothetical protein